MAQLAIKGHATRAKEVIEILGILGGSNDFGHIGNNPHSIYYIDETYKNYIGCSETKKVCDCVVFTLEEFLEKYPYKVGDKVIDKTDGRIGIVGKMYWEEHTSCVKYRVTFGRGVDFGWYSAQFLQPYKEETMKGKKLSSDAVFLDCSMVDKIELALGNTHEVVVEDGKTFIVRKKPQYPKTYEECCKVLGYSGNYNMILTTDVDNKLFNALYRLKVCRDAYWKIAGKQMGLGKPWKPNWHDNEKKYTIEYYGGGIVKDFSSLGNRILVFPSAEMRDAFFENFEELIEKCKELL